MPGFVSWRAILPFVAVTLAVMLGLAVYVPADLRPAVLFVALLQAALMAALAILVRRRTMRAVERVSQVMRRLAQGEWGARLVIGERSERSELHSLRSHADAFNRMADRFQQSLADAERQRDDLAAVLEHMTDGVLIVDDEERVRLINQAATQLLGTTVEDALGRSFAQVARDHNLIENAQTCLRQGIEDTVPVELSHLGLFLQASLIPLRENDRSACLVILQNVTQLRHLETVRRDFVSNISHELRTPLASLKALVDTLRDGALDDPPAAQRFLDRVEGETDAMTQIVQELLELSRTESGQAPVRLIATPLADIVLPPAERLRPQVERARLELTVNLPAGLPPVLADRDRIQQVVTNLVQNAIKFTPAGGRITVSVQSAGDEIVISVQDTGIGVADDDLQRIFERFYKADRARSGGGTGLGLAIARHVVQAHGGRIWAESVEGKGSTFFFTLSPAAEPSGAVPQ